MLETIQVKVTQPTSTFQDLLESYNTLEKQFPIQDCQERYSSLVTANSDQDFPIQRWFRMKEAFSIDLLGTLLNDWKVPVDSIRRAIDPFCGVSTSLLAFEKLAKERDLKDIEILGIERNPFLHFIGQAKLSWNSVNAIDFKRQVRRLRYRVKRNDIRFPLLSTLRRAYDGRRLRYLLGVREAIRTAPRVERDLLLLGFANVLEKASRVRKDGRALRFTKGKRRIKVSGALESIWNLMAQDLLVLAS